MRNATGTCFACKDGAELPFDFTMAFQPIVGPRTGSVYAYEALARGPEGQSAGWVLAQVNEGNRYIFDQTCRVRAITLAKKLGLEQTSAKLSINFMPGAVYSAAACIQLTLKTARAAGLPLDRLIFEITKSEYVQDKQHLKSIFDEYRSHGFRMALDDFGAGYSGLTLLAALKPDILKLDMELIQDIDSKPTARAIVRMMASLCQELGIDLIAEGVETLAELEAIISCDIYLVQGYLIAKPAFEALPTIVISDLPMDWAFTSLSRPASIVAAAATQAALTHRAATSS